MATITGTLTGTFHTSRDVLFHRRMMHMQREERARREKQERLESGESQFVDLAVSFVSIAQVHEFRAELDVYDTATITALEECRVKLEAAEQRLNDMLDRAHVLPDGRRVFKTEDGTRVFDEHGVEIDASVIEPEEISDALDKWEDVSAAFDQVEQLKQMQRDLLDYQDRLDAARDRLDTGDITQDEFDNLKSDLTDNMPDAVRAHVPGMEITQNAALSSPEATANLAEDLDITADDDPGAMKFTR